MLHTVFYNIADRLTAPGEIPGQCGLCRNVQLHLLLPQFHWDGEGLQHAIHEFLYLYLFLYKDRGTRVNTGDFKQSLHQPADAALELSGLVEELATLLRVGLLAQAGQHQVQGGQGRPQLMGDISQGIA